MDSSCDSSIITCTHYISLCRIDAMESPEEAGSQSLLQRVVGPSARPRAGQAAAGRRRSILHTHHPSAAHTLLCGDAGEAIDNGVLFISTVLEQWSAYYSPEYNCALWIVFCLIVLLRLCSPFQSGVMIPTSVYQAVFECVMKLLTLPSPYSAVALSTVRSIKMEMTTPGTELEFIVQ